MKKIFFCILFLYLLINQCFSLDNNLYNKIIDSIETNESVESQLLTQLIDQNQSNKVFLFSLVNKLRVYYTEKYFLTHSKSIGNLEDFFSTFFGLQSRLGYFNFLVDREIFNSYTTNEFSYFSALSGNENQIDNLQRIKTINLYIGLSELRKSKIDYQVVSNSLLNSVEYKTKDNHYEQLKNALQQTNQYELLLSIELYRSFDRFDFDKIDFKEYEQIYKQIKNPKYSFNQYIELSKKEVLLDYKKKFECNNVKFNEINLENDKKQQILISNVDKQSIYYNKKLFLIFFSVTCKNCLAEMNVINKMQKYFEDKNIVPIAIYTLFNKSVNASEQLVDFKHNHNYFFDLYLDNNGNELAKKYKIPHVPFCLLVDNNNQIVCEGGFNHYGNIQEKVEKLIINFIDKK